MTPTQSTLRRMLGWSSATARNVARDGEKIAHDSTLKNFPKIVTANACEQNPQPFTEVV